MKKNTVQLESQESISFSSSEPRFEPREDDNENLWEVIAIVAEKPHSYQVEWAGNDPKTKKPWPPSWVRKGDVTDDLVIKWKAEKKRKNRKMIAMKNVGPRASTATTSTTTTAAASRSGSRRTSVSKASTPTATVVTPNGNRKGTVRKMVSSRFADDRQPSASNSVSPDRDTKRPTRIHKRRRERSSSPPEAVATSSTSASKPKDNVVTPRRPQKKRKLEPIGEGRRREADEEKDERGRTKKVRYETEASVGEEMEIVQAKAAKSPPPSPPQHVNGVKETSDLLHMPSKPAPRSKQRRNTANKATARIRRKKRRNEGATFRDISPNTLERLRQFDAELEELEREKQKQEKLKAEAEARRIREREQAQEWERLSKQAQGQPTTQEDDEISALEYCEEIPAPSPPSPNHQPSQSQPQQPPHPPMSMEVPDLSYAPKTKSPTTIATTSYPKTAPTNIPNKPRPSNNDSYRHGIVPETEFEDSSGNTQSQSQSLSLTQSQAVPLPGTNAASPPSMVVEPPASLRSPPQTPSRPLSAASATIISGLRPKSRSGFVESVANLADVDLVNGEREDEDGQQQQQPESIWLEKVEDAKKTNANADANDKVNAKLHTPMISVLMSSKFASYLPSTGKRHLPSGSSIVGGDEIEDITSSIEQFSSPEKQRTKAKSAPTSIIDDGKGRTVGTTATTMSTSRPQTGRSSSSEPDQIQRRGKELAEAARQAKMKSLPRASKKPLGELLRQRKPAFLENDVRFGAVSNATTTVAALVMEVSPSTTPSSSLLVPDSDRALPEVSDDVVKQMEAAYVDLDGGRGGAMDEDITVDGSNSLSVEKSIEGKAMEGGLSVVALRQEEEESTQDLLRDARTVDESEKVEDGPALGGDHDESSERQGNVEDQEMADIRQSSEPQPPSPIASGADRLEALLQQEQLRNQELQNEIASLRQALELAKAGTSACTTSSDSPFEHQLTEIKVAYDNDKAQWDAERNSLTAATEAATKAKESAIKDGDFFRENYARASGFVTSIREENQELENRAKIAEDQAKSGVALIKATYDNRVKELERHVEKWQMMATFLVQKDQRTDNDELRKRASEHPELKAMCRSLEEEVSMLRAEIVQLEEELKQRDKAVEDVGSWRQETERLAVELHEARVEMGRLSQASGGSEMVFRCLWRTEANKPCDEIFPTIEALKNHFYAAGHIHWD